MKSKIVNRVLDLAVEIQKIPAPTFGEQHRAAFVLEQFKKLDSLKDLVIDDVGNVYARLPGNNVARPIVVSAHLDTVFPGDLELAATRSPSRISGAGIGDNSLGVAGLQGLLWALYEDNVSLPGDMWLVATVGEEGLGDSQGMQAVVDRFGGRPLAYIVIEGMAYERIFHRALGVRRYRITIKTKGGHSWVDFGEPSAIHELASLVTKMSAIQLPDSPRTTLNVGLITGGTSVNTIAPTAYLDLDLRSTDLSQLNNLVELIQQEIREANRKGVQVEMDLIGARPMGEIPADHKLVDLASQVLIGQGVTPNLSIGSTDANIPLSRGVPAICIGLTHGGGAHTINEYILTRPLKAGLEQALKIVFAIFDNMI
ncbi:MAG: M20/M25/M40 family metallo-hydrolase [Chloroflexi bacterium]|nr:M20/M25/M40 family metallo-hydrolase [Chloroflexota bacterium]